MWWNFYTIYHILILQLNHGVFVDIFWFIELISIERWCLNSTLFFKIIFLLIKVWIEKRYYLKYHGPTGAYYNWPFGHVILVGNIWSNVLMSIERWFSNSVLFCWLENNFSVHKSVRWGVGGGWGRIPTKMTCSNSYLLQSAILPCHFSWYLIIKCIRILHCLGVENSLEIENCMGEK